jgi:hypothetical protein
MNTEAVLDDLRSRIEAGYPLLFLQTWEEQRWESELAELSLEMERGLVTWTITSGLLPAPSEETALEPSAWHLLLQLGEYPPRASVSRERFSRVDRRSRHRAAFA